MAILKLKNGGLAHVEGSWAYPAGTAFRMTFEVVGTNAQIEFDNLESSPVIKHTNEIIWTAILRFPERWNLIARS